MKTCWGVIVTFGKTMSMLVVACCVGDVMCSHCWEIGFVADSSFFAIGLLSLLLLLSVLLFLVSFMVSFPESGGLYCCQNVPVGQVRFWSLSRFPPLRRCGMVRSFLLLVWQCIF